MTVFLGHTRFSIDAHGSDQFNATRKKSLFASREEYLGWLYDDDRLARRAEILLGWSVPQLQRAAEGHQVRHVISHSSTLPEKYKEMLRQAAEDYPVLALNEVDAVVDPYAPPEHVMSEALKDFGLTPGTAFCAYRLDDDDVLAANYFDQLAPHVHPFNVGYRVSLGYGFTGLWRNSRLYYCTETYYPKISMGLASVLAQNEDGSFRTPQNEYKGNNGDNHTTADRTAPVILDSRQPAYFRVLHPTQSGVLHNTKEIGRHWYLESLRRVQSAAPAKEAEIATHFPVLADSARLTHGEPHEIQEVISEDTVVGGKSASVNFEAAGELAVEIEFDSTQTASNHDLEIKWAVEHPEGADLQKHREFDYSKQSNLKWSARREVFYSRVPTRGRYGRWRHTVVQLPEEVTVKGIKIFSNTKTRAKIKRVRITQL